MSDKTKKQDKTGHVPASGPAVVMWRASYYDAPQEFYLFEKRQQAEDMIRDSGFVESVVVLPEKKMKELERYHGVWVDWEKPLPDIMRIIVHTTNHEQKKALFDWLEEYIA